MAIATAMFTTKAMATNTGTVMATNIGTAMDIHSYGYDYGYTATTVTAIAMTTAMAMTTTMALTTAMAMTTAMGMALWLLFYNFMVVLLCLQRQLHLSIYLSIYLTFISMHIATSLLPLRQIEYFGNKFFAS